MIKNQVSPKIFLLAALLGASPMLSAKVVGLGEFTPLNPLSKGEWRDLRKGDVIVRADIHTKAALQSLDYYAAGFHPRTCRKALKKISLYESYQDFISFITKSQYDEKNKSIYLRFEHKLMPTRLSLRFTIPRITSSGRYPFSFDHGLLSGLQGKIQVSPHGQRCLMELRARWKGPYTKINDLVFETFAITLGKLGIRKIFRISSL